MTEIRSTLDIIMERTRNLTMTEEEKRKIKEEETAKKVRGLLQKFLDGFIDIEKLRIETAASEKDGPEVAARLMGDEVLARIEPGKDNSALFSVMEEALHVDTGPIRKTLKTFEQKMGEERRNREKALSAEFMKRGISGSAVIPNLEGDAGWQERVASIKLEVEEILKNQFKQVSHEGTRPP